MPIQQLQHWLFTIGYSLAFGAVLAKMWRVYQIFNNPTPKKKVCLPGQYYGHYFKNSHSTTDSKGQALGTHNTGCNCGCNDTADNRDGSSTPAGRSFAETRPRVSYGNICRFCNQYVANLMLFIIHCRSSLE